MTREEVVDRRDAITLVEEPLPPSSSEDAIWDLAAKRASPSAETGACSMRFTAAATTECRGIACTAVSTFGLDAAAYLSCSSMTNPNVCPRIRNTGSIFMSVVCNLCYMIYSCLSLTCLPAIR
jgi:hypothetical protein